MARWQITIDGKGVRRASVEKLAAKLKEEFGKDAHIGVLDATRPESRADRFQAALSNVSDGKNEIESLRDELQEWYDNLPESFQGGSKGEELQTAIDELEEIAGELENVEGRDVSFPSMY